MKKKLTAMLVALAMSISMAAPAAYAKTNTAPEVQYVTVQPEKNGLMRPEVSLFSSYENEEAKAAIIAGLKNMDKEIDVSKYDITKDNIKDFYYEILYTTPELCHVRTGYSYSSYTSGEIVKIMPIYVEGLTTEDVKKAEEKIEDIIKTHIDDRMTDAEKALVLHDYLVHTIDYTSVRPVPETAFTAYGALMLGDAVCQGYTLAYGWLLSKCGIAWEFVSSDEMNHAWDMIKLDGEWYHVDVTWDDPTNIKSITYNHFLKTDDQFVKNPTNPHYNWISDNKAEGTKYSTGSWVYSEATNDDVITKFNKDNNMYYFIGKTYTNSIYASDLPNDRLGLYNNKNGNGYAYYYTIYKKANFDGSNEENSTKAEYDEVVYPFEYVEPTPTPTVEPTATPTAEPTATPTAEPTATPTAEPTATPTAEPTATPTAEPTATPTAEPTATPTATPTPVPDKLTYITGEAKDITTTTATLTGTFILERSDNPSVTADYKGGSFTVWTDDTDSKTYTVDMVITNAGTYEVEYKLSDLEPNTVYNYKYEDGETKTFKTKAIAPYGIKDIRITLENGEALDKIPTDKGFITEITVVEQLERDNKDLFIIAVYDKDGNLIGINYAKANLPLGGEFSFGMYIAPNENINMICAFVWDGLDTMNVLSYKYALVNEEIPDDTPPEDENGKTDDNESKE